MLLPFADVVLWMGSTIADYYCFAYDDCSGIKNVPGGINWKTKVQDMKEIFSDDLPCWKKSHEALLSPPNEQAENGNGIF